MIEYLILLVPAFGVFAAGLFAGVHLQRWADGSRDDFVAVVDLERAREALRPKGNR